MDEWFRTFFDQLYYETYSIFEDEERNLREAKFIIESMGLSPGSRVLDLGCGYGRHAVYLARQGYYVVCLDLSEYMIRKAEERVAAFNVSNRVELVHSDMRELKYRSEFDGIYMFFTTFGYFSDEENSILLERMSNALKPAGVLLLDLWNPVHIFHIAYINNGVHRIWLEAGDYTVLEETHYDVLNARVNTKRIFYKKGWIQPEERSFSVRVYTYWELRDMMEKAGLRIERTYGSYRGDEYKPASPRMILLARKLK